MAPPPSRPRRARETFTQSQGHREQTRQLHTPDEPPSHLHTSNVPKVRVACPSAVSGGSAADRSWLQSLPPSSHLEVRPCAAGWPGDCNDQ